MSAEEIQINNSRYWDNRFEQDWEDNGGRGQSAFFSAIVFQHLPLWMKRFLVQKQPSFCDWGCALGDGTDYLRRALGLTNVWGIDFSATSIEKAKQFYPGVQFVHADLTKDHFEQKFDIIFSSNTLEHFYDPWTILTTISKSASQHLILLIPYQEYELCSKEHFYTFNARNIPFSIDQTFFLTHSTVIDTVDWPATHWFGKQILLIYTHQQHAADLFLGDISITDKETGGNSIVPELNKITETEQPVPDLSNAAAPVQNTELEQCNVKLAQQEIEIQTYASVQSDLMGQLAKQKDAYVSILKELQKATVANATQCEQLENKSREGEAQVQVLLENTTHLQQQNEALQRSIEAYDKRGNQLTTQIEGLQAEMNSIMEEKELARQVTQQLEGEFITVTSEKNSYYQGIVAVKEELNLLEAKLSAALAENENLVLQQVQLQEHIQQIEQSPSWQLLKSFGATIERLRKNVGIKPKQKADPGL